jgi:alkylation response protein AidB-like acyl-CoA dehydrogenase
VSPHFLTDVQREFHDSVRRFADQRIAPLAAEIDETDEFPSALFREMAALGYLGAPYPSEWGGAGCDSVMVALLLEEVSRASGAVGSSLNAHISLACSVIYHHGSEAQKRAYLSRLTTGEAIGAFGLTEPSGGSDAAACRTRAVCRGDEYLITGQKSFNTNGPVAEIFVITARTSEAPGARGVSAFIVERDTPGFVVGRPDRKHGVHGSPTATLYFEEARVPAANLIGREGEGFRQFARTLDLGRVNVAALALGIGQAALDAAVAYARQREAFGRPIAAYQGVQFPIAEAATEIEAARLLTLSAARLADAGRPIKKEAAMAKFFAAEAALRAANAAVEIFGGHGYMREHAVERYLRDAKMCQIGEGTSQIQRMIIAREVLGRYA